MGAREKAHFDPAPSIAVSFTRMYHPTKSAVIDSFRVFSRYGVHFSETHYNSEEPDPKPVSLPADARLVLARLAGVNPRRLVLTLQMPDVFVDGLDRIPLVSSAGSVVFEG